MPQFDYDPNYYDNYTPDTNNIVAGGIDKNRGSVVNELRQYGTRALFLTALANLEWSRGYTWYVELDDVPPPFHRGGVLGLPVTGISYDLVSVEEHNYNAGMSVINVPKARVATNVTLNFIDDEQATMFTFFERWYNEIYNQRIGVLPVTEACKMLSVYKLKASRRPITRYTVNYNPKNLELSKHKKDSRQLLVYPYAQLQENEKGDTGDPRNYTIELRIVKEFDPDFGNPSEHEAQIFGVDINSNSFWARVADYI